MGGFRSDRWRACFDSGASPMGERIDSWIVTCPSFEDLAKRPEIHPLSPEVCGDRSGRGHRNRRNRLDVRAPLNLASANAFLLSEHDLHLACAIASGLCDPVLPNCSHPRDIGPSTPKGTFWCLCLKCLAFSWEPLTHSSRPRSDAFPPLCFIILHP